MNDYIFFDAALAERFVAFVAGHGIEARLRPDALEGCVVALPDDLDADLDDAIEDHYDALMREQRERVEAAEGDGARSLIGVDIALPDGRAITVRLPAQYGRRLLENFSIDEIRALVSEIARNVLDPVDGPLCRDA